MAFENGNGNNMYMPVTSIEGLRRSWALFIFMERSL